MDGEKEGRAGDNGLDSGQGVGNDLDRERVDVVVYGVDMPACDVLAFQVLLVLPKETSRRNTTSTSSIQQHSSSRIGPAANNGNHEMGQQGTRPCRTPETIQ